MNEEEKLGSEAGAEEQSNEVTTQNVSSVDEAPSASPEEVKEETKEIVKEEVKGEVKDKVEVVEERVEEASDGVTSVEEKVEEEVKEEKVSAEVEVLESEQPKEEEVKRWYIVQTLTGYEERVKRAIERSIAEANLQSQILNVLIPEEEVVEIRNNRRIEKVRKMYPGYIFVEMILSEETWYTIRQTPGVARFIGSKVKPVPVTDREMQRVLKQLGVKDEMVEVEFEVGESIRVISGPFRGYSGSVNEINLGKNKIKVLINIFGRDTPVEIDFDQAEKIV
jgi:transcriptional antiterminator NusG